MMRVLHVIPSVAERSGGPATAIVPMCRALQQNGVEVLLVTTAAGMRDANNTGGKPPVLSCSSSTDLKETSVQFAETEDFKQEQVRKGGSPPLTGNYKG